MTVADRLEALGLAALLVALSARRLQEPCSGDAEHQSANGKRPRPAAAEVLDVGQQLVTVRVVQPAADALDVAGGLIRDPRRLVLALLAQLLADGANVPGRRMHALAEIGRALVDLGPRLVGGLRLGLLCLLLSLLAYFRRSLSHIDPPFLWYSE